MKSKFWNFTAKSKDDGELTLYGDISSVSWFGDEITPVQFKQDLDGLGDIKNLNIYINSGGGDVFAGQAIYSIIKRHKANKTVYVDGLAASIASVIAMAGDKVVMPSNAMMMIHDPYTIMIGNATEMRKMADDLEKITESIVNVYAEKSGMNDMDILALMNVETWMTAEDAKQYGFADEVEAEKKIAASVKGDSVIFNGVEFSTEHYKNLHTENIIQEEIVPKIVDEVVEDVPEVAIEVVSEPEPVTDKEDYSPVIDLYDKAIKNIDKRILLNKKTEVIVNV